MNALTRTVVAAVVVALAGATPAGSAQAVGGGYDASGLCPTAKPTRTQLAATLDTVRQNSATAAGLAQGLDIDQAGLIGVGSYSYDGTRRRARFDYAFEGAIVGGAHGVYAGTNIYEGHLADDEPDVRSALRALGRTEAWTRSTGRPPATEQLLLDSALTDFSSLGAFESLAMESSLGHAFSCTVTAAGKLVLKDSFSDADAAFSGTQVETLTFTDTGALSAGRLTVPGFAEPISADTFSYAAVQVDLPGPVISDRTWQPAYVQASFGNLKNATLKSARAAAKKQRTVAKRVAAVRRAARAKAGDYYAARAGVGNVTNGVKVRVKRPYSSKYWYFTLTVKGSKVSVKSNLPTTTTTTTTTTATAGLTSTEPRPQPTVIASSSRLRNAEASTGSWLCTRPTGGCIASTTVSWLVSWK